MVILITRKYRSTPRRTAFLYRIIARCFIAILRFQRSSFGYHASRKTSFVAILICHRPRKFRIATFPDWTIYEIVSWIFPPGTSSWKHSTLFTIPGKGGIIIQREYKFIQRKYQKFGDEILERVKFSRVDCYPLKKV